MSIVLIPLSWFSDCCSFWKRYAKAIQWHYKSFGNAHFAEKYWKSASSSFRTTFSFPLLPSCLVNQPDISWFWQIWHIYEAAYLSAQQEQKSIYLLIASTKNLPTLSPQFCSPSPMVLIEILYISNHREKEHLQINVNVTKLDNEIMMKKGLAVKGSLWHQDMELLYERYALH